MLSVKFPADRNRELGFPVLRVNREKRYAVLPGVPAGRIQHVVVFHRRDAIYVLTLAICSYIVLKSKKERDEYLRQSKDAATGQAPKGRGGM